MQLCKLKISAIAFLCLASTSLSAQKAPKKASEEKMAAVEKTVGIKPEANSMLETLYKEAVAWLKTPYRRGGTSSKGMDCSGFTSTIYKNVFGIELKRSSNEMSKQDVEDVTKEDLQPGDLVFFATSRKKNTVNHVGVYLGNDHFVHASTSNGVIVSSLNEPYYKRTWIKGGQVKELDYNNELVLDTYFKPQKIENKQLLVKAENLDQSHVPTILTLPLINNTVSNQ